MSISGLGGSPFAGMRGTFQPPSFDSFDTNNDGSISLDELTAGAPGGASKSDDKRAEALFKAMDANGDGSVSADEKSAFDQKLQDRQTGLAFLAQQLSGSSSNADVFAATDTNGDGSVSLAEFSDDPAAKGVGSDSLQKLFSLIDSNGDGSISASESSSFLDQVKSAVTQSGSPPGRPHGHHGGGGGVGGLGGLGGADGTQGSTDPIDQLLQAMSTADADGDSDGSTGTSSDSASSDSSSSSNDVLQLARNAYSTTGKPTDLISMLQSLLQTAA